jgi:excisionase family DNA binding protein
MPDLADFMTTEEAAKLLGFNVKSVRDLVYKGKLKSSRFGRSLLIPRDSVKDYIKKTTGMSKNDPRRGK